VGNERKRKRIAIIGAGNHARDQHYPALDHIDEIELCAACDLVPEKLEAVREQYEIPATYADYREMIEAEGPDGVVIVMQPEELVGVALGCLELGMHVMVEKPPGCNVEEASRILDLANEKGCKVMVSLNRRFIPLIRHLKAMALERGLVCCSSTYNKAGFTGDQWKSRASLPLADSIHNIDLMRFIGGEVTDVFAASASRDADYTNAHSAAIVYESGAMGTINTHHCVGFRVHRFEIHAMGMSAYLDVGDTHHPSCELFLDGEPSEPPRFELDLPPNVGIENYYETLHFARWVADEEEGEADLTDVLESVKLCEAVVAGHRGAMDAG
jgi:predicted dehydrogenase